MNIGHSCTPLFTLKEDTYEKTADAPVYPVPGPLPSVIFLRRGAGAGSLPICRMIDAKRWCYRRRSAAPVTVSNYSDMKMTFIFLKSVISIGNL
jgi:hypothetical protein